MAVSEVTSVQNSHRVVVGVDGSPASLQALQWALGYASATNSLVDVVVAWEWPTSLAWSAPFPSDYDPDMNAQQMLDDLIEHQRAEHPNLVIDGRVVEGDPATVLESASNGAALLVVAQRGHGELVGLLLGSVSEHCVTHAHCPVLVYRDDPLSASSQPSS